MPLDATTAITIPGLPAGVLLWDESTREEFTPTSQTAVRVLRCRWGDRVTVAQLLRGQPAIAYVYAPPLAYPDIPWLFVHTVETKGIVGADPTTGLATGLKVSPTGMVAYTYAQLRVTYRTMDYIAAQQLGSLELDFGNQVLTLSGTSASGATMKFAVTGRDSVEDAPIRLTTIQFAREVKQVKTLPIATLLAAAQAPVNSQPFNLPTNSSSLTTGGATAPVGSVLFQGCKSRRAIDTYGSERWDLSFSFVLRNVPWGFALNPALAATSAIAVNPDTLPYAPFEQLVFKATGQPIYASSDLNLLLNPNAA